MFGTIGHARIRAGQKEALDGLMRDWKQTIRPLVPGAFLEVTGHRAGLPEELVFLALAEGEATYRHLADLPEQDGFYRRMVELLETEPTWEDVEMDITVPA